MTTELINKYVTWVYSLYGKCKEETCLEQLIEFHNSEELSTVFGKTIPEDTVQQVRAVMRTFNNDKLYAYCCGSLIPIPQWHSDVFLRFIESILTVIDTVFEEVD